MTHSTPSKFISGLFGLAVCILLLEPAIAAGKYWTDPRTGITWTTDPQVCGPRGPWAGESWVKIQTWTDPRTGAVWTTDRRATGPRFNGWNCSWVEILVWFDSATGAIWTTDPNASGPKVTGWGHTWTNISPSPNLAAAFGWRQYAETDLQLSEFYEEDFTVIARIMVQFPLGYTGPILAATGGGFEISKQVGASQIHARFGGSTFMYSMGPLQGETWHHISITRLEGFLYLYLDGNQICPDGSGSCEVAAGISSGLLRIGRAGANPLSRLSENQYYGFIDDVAVFNTALSQSQIQELVAKARLDGSETGLYAGWTFDEVSMDGNATPAVLSRPVTYYQVTPTGRVTNPFPFTAVVSDTRDSAMDARFLLPPNNQIPLKLPFPSGEAWEVIQGWEGFSHRGRATFAVDFRLAGQPQSATDGKPFYAAAPGPVVQVEDDRTSCSGSPANHIDIEHTTDEYGVYLHHVRNSAAVTVGQNVSTGTYLADTGDTGNSGCNAFHLHFALHDLPESEATYLVTIPGAFENYEVSNDGGQTWSPVVRGVVKRGEWVRNP